MGNSEVGLLATQYSILFANSISTASFYVESVDVDSHDARKVVDVDVYMRIHQLIDNLHRQLEERVRLRVQARQCHHGNSSAHAAILRHRVL